jgi:hypothetical protein
MAVGKSIYDAMIFGTWTVGSVMMFLTLIGFIQWNI